MRPGTTLTRLPNKALHADRRKRCTFAVPSALRAPAAGELTQCHLATLREPRLEGFGVGGREKLVKFGAKIVSHGRYVTFQLAEMAIPWRLFAEILQLIDSLRPKPAPI